MPSRTWIAAACLSLVVATGATAQEWTRFRGPNGSGQSDATTIPVSWGENEHLWKVALPGIGQSSPVLWGERIFLTSADPNNGTQFVLCVSAVDGSKQWTQEFPSKTHKIHTQNSLASSTPTVDEQHVYCAWATPEEFSVAALAHDGKQVWRANLGPFVSQHGFGTSPIVHGDLLIITNDQDADSYLIALDKSSGQTRWKIPRKVLDKQNASYAAPCIYQPSGGPAELIVCSWAHGISSIDPKNGQTNWQAEVLERRPVGSPILAGGLILANCGEGSGNNSVVAVRPGSADGREAEVIYKVDRTSAPYVPTMVAHGSLVFLWGDRGVVTCIDVQSGKQHWQKRVGGNYSGSPVCVGNRIYGVSAEGEVVTLAASDKFDVLGHSLLGESTRATPAVAGGRMFLRTESHMIAVGKNPVAVGKNPVADGTQ